MRLAGKTALITGAGSGLGRGIARRFAAEGCAVLAAGRRPAPLEAVVDEIGRAGGRARALPLDVREEASLDAALAAAAQDGWRPDLLVANAGIAGPEGDAAALDCAAWDEVLRVNVTGVLLSARACLPAMRARGGGAIVTIASVGGLAGVRGLIGYATAKAAVINLTRTLALDHAHEGIRANCLAPAFVETDMTRDVFTRAADPAAARARIIAHHPLGRLGTPEDVAAAAVFLASDEAAWITGAVLPVDGGFSCRLA